MTRLEGERLRVIHHLQRLRTIVEHVLSDLERNAPIPGPDVAQAVAHTGVDVARSLSALVAFDLDARDNAHASTTDETEARLEASESRNRAEQGRFYPGDAECTCEPHRNYDNQFCPKHGKAREVR